MHLKIVQNKPELKTCFEIRKIVFVEEQNVSLEEEFDEYEDVSTHYLVDFKGKYVATARIRETEFGIKLERISVLKEFRNLGIGKFLVKNLLTSCEKCESSRIYLNSQIVAVGFYENFEFNKIGEEFLDAGIVHIQMEKFK